MLIKLKRAALVVYFSVELTNSSHKKNITWPTHNGKAKEFFFLGWRAKIW